MGKRAWIFGVALAVSASCEKPTDTPSKGEPAGKSAAPVVDTKDGKVAEDAAGKAALPEAAALLEKAVTAVGGKEKLAAVESFYFEGTLSVAGQNIAGDMKLWWKGGDFYSEQTMIGIGTIRGGKQGDVIWSDDPINGLRRLSGTEAEQYSWTASLLLAADWQRYFGTASTLGARTLEGKQVYDVELVSKSGAKVTLTFDADTGLQVAQSFKAANPMGEMPVTAELQDYREVGGIELPHKQVIDASLAKATQQITKIELNGTVDTSKFAMPTGGAQVVKPTPAPDQPLGTQ